MIKMSAITNNKGVVIAIGLGSWDDECSFLSELVVTFVFGRQ